MRILLAIDGSEQSEAAVDEIARQHFPADSEVRVISVVERPYYPAMLSGEGVNMSLYVEIEKTAREQAGSAVEKAAAKLRADEGSRQLNITTEVLSGLPKQVILEEAEAFGADLIVVGSHVFFLHLHTFFHHVFFLHTFARALFRGHIAHLVAVLHDGNGRRGVHKATAVSDGC